MDPLFRVSWFGASDQRYAFDVFDIEKQFAREQEGTFIFARISSRNTWMPLYIGEGKLHDPLWAHPQSRRCLEEKDATHIHVRFTDDQQRRVRVVKDLMEQYVMVFNPVGCNQQQDYRRLGHRQSAS